MVDPVLEPIDNRVVEVLTEADTSTTEEDRYLTELSSGFVLRHKRVPPMILAKIDEKYADPPVPMIRDQEKERNIPNYDDPNYQNDLIENKMKRGNAVIDVLIGMGTTIEYAPEGKQLPEDEEWADELLFVGIEVPKLRLGRYLAWVKYYAAETTADIQKLAKKGSAILGVTEEDVAEAIANFPSEPTRRADTADQA